MPRWQRSTIAAARFRTRPARWSTSLIQRFGSVCRGPGSYSRSSSRVPPRASRSRLRPSQPQGCRSGTCVGIGNRETRPIASGSRSTKRRERLCAWARPDRSLGKRSPPSTSTRWPYKASPVPCGTTCSGAMITSSGDPRSWASSYERSGQSSAGRPAARRRCSRRPRPASPRPRQ